MCGLLVFGLVTVEAQLNGAPKFASVPRIWFAVHHPIGVLHSCAIVPSRVFCAKPQVAPMLLQSLCGVHWQKPPALLLQVEPAGKGLIHEHEIGARLRIRLSS